MGRCLHDGTDGVADEDEDRDGGMRRWTGVTREMTVTIPMKLRFVQLAMSDERCD